MKNWTKKYKQDLAAKIDWEGGLLEYFCNYSIPENFKDTPIEKEVRNFYDAYQLLQSKLEEIGVVLDDEEY